MIKKFVMSRPVLPVNEINVLNTTKYYLINYTHYFKCHFAYVCSSYPSFCPIDNMITMYRYFFICIHVTVLLSSAAVTLSHPMSSIICIIVVFIIRFYSIIY